MKVADFTPEQLRALIRESVAEALAEVLDPDKGLDLREDLVAYLQNKQQSDGVPIEDVVKDLDLNW